MTEAVDKLYKSLYDLVMTELPKRHCKRWRIFNRRHCYPVRRRRRLLGDAGIAPKEWFCVTHQEWIYD